jgi:hypothetical protein
VGDTVAQSSVTLRGRLGGRGVDVELPAAFIDFDTLELTIADPEAVFGDDEGTFEGSVSAVVSFIGDDARYASPPIPVRLEIRRTLDSTLGLFQGA